MLVVSSENDIHLNLNYTDRQTQRLLDQLTEDRQRRRSMRFVSARGTRIQNAVRVSQAAECLCPWRRQAESSSGVLYVYHDQKQTSSASLQSTTTTA